MDAEIISCEDFAERVGTSSRTIRRKIESGKLRGPALSIVEGRKIPFLVYHIAIKQYEATADRVQQRAKKLQNRVDKKLLKLKEDKEEKKTTTKEPEKNQKTTTKEPEKNQKAAKKISKKKKVTTKKVASKKTLVKKAAEPKPKQPEAEKLSSGEEIKDKNEEIYDRLAMAKMESEEYKATLQRLKIEKEQGKLVDADTAKETIIKLVGETRKAFLNLPDNLGPELLACKDLLDLQNKLTEGINQALLNLSRLNSLEQVND